MTYSEDELSRIENLLDTDPTIKLGPLDYQDEECITLEYLTVKENMHVDAKEYRKVIIPKFYPLVDGKYMEGTMWEMMDTYAEHDWQIPSLPLYIAIAEEIDMMQWSAEKNGDEKELKRLTDMINKEHFVFKPREMPSCNTIIDYDQCKIIHNALTKEYGGPDDQSLNGIEKRFTSTFEKDKIEFGALTHEVNGETMDFFEKLTGIGYYDMFTSMENLGADGGSNNLMNTDNGNFRGALKGKVIPFYNVQIQNLNFIANGNPHKIMKIPFCKVIE